MPRSFEIAIASSLDGCVKDEIVTYFDHGRLVISSVSGVKLSYDETTGMTSTYRGDQLTGVYQGCPKATRIRPITDEESENSGAKLERICWRTEMLAFGTGVALGYIIRILVTVF